MTDNTQGKASFVRRSDHAVVVMESTGQWAAALRRQLADHAVRVVETRSRAECLEVIARFSSALVVVEILASDMDRGLNLLVDLDERFGQRPVIAVGQPECKRHEWLARELGAVQFATSDRGLLRVTPMMIRYFACRPPAADRVTEQIWADLPWGD